MMRIDSRSALRGKVAHPPLEQRPRGVRSRPRLGMELERASAQFRIRKSLDGAVVERDVRDLGGIGRIDAEAVVLRGHEHAPALALEHGMIRTAVTEGKLRRREAGRPAE